LAGFALLLTLGAACSFSSSSAAVKPPGEAATVALSSVDSQPADDIATPDVETAVEGNSDGPTIEVVRRSQFNWPALGPITTYFGPGHPTGIDIGLDLDADSPIKASAAGTVSFAGGEP